MREEWQESERESDGRMLGESRESGRREVGVAGVSCECCVIVM